MIGTTAAIALGLGAIGGQTAAGIYGTRSAGRQNRRAQDLQADEGRRAQEDARAERELIAQQAAEDRRLLAEEQTARRALDERKQTEAQARWNQAMTQDQSRWQDYLRANEPHWNQGGRVLGNLFDLAGMSGGAPSMPDTRSLAGASFEARSAAAPSAWEEAAARGSGPRMPDGRRAPMSLDALAGSSAGSVPVSRPLPVRAPQRARMAARRPFPTMAQPSSGGMSLQQLASLAALANRGSGGGITPTDPMYAY